MRVRIYHLETYRDIEVEALEEFSCPLNKYLCTHAIVMDNAGRLAETYIRPPWNIHTALVGAIEEGFGKDET